MSGNESDNNDNPAELRIQLLSDENRDLKEQIGILEAKLKASDTVNAQMAQVLDQQNRQKMYADIRKVIKKDQLTDEELQAHNSDELKTLWNHAKLVNVPGASVKPDSVDSNFDPRQGLTVGDRFLSQMKK